MVTILLAIIAQKIQVHSQDYTGGPFIEVGGKYVRWGDPSEETVTITYAYAKSASEFKDGLPRGRCVRTEPLNKLLRRSEIEFAEFDEQVVKALRSWEQVTNIRFVYTEREDEADIRIAAQTDPERIAYTNLSLHPPDEKEYRRIKKAIICLNPELRWSLEFSDNQKIPSIDSVVQHETGHAFGLDHIEKKIGARMSLSYTGQTKFLPEDIIAAQTRYGIKRE